MRQSHSAAPTVNLENAIWIWTMPVGGLASERPARILACHSNGHLSFPNVCCRCVRQNAVHPYPVNIHPISGEENWRWALLFGGQAGHLAEAIIEFTTPKVNVPVCNACRRLRRAGSAAGMCLFLCGMALLYYFVYRATDKEASSPVSTGILVSIVFAGLILIVCGYALSSWLNRLAVPVEVFRLDQQQIYYEFRSKRFQSFILEQLHGHNITPEETPD